MFKKNISFGIIDKVKTPSQLADHEKIMIWHESKDQLNTAQRLLIRAETDYERAVDIEGKARKEVQKIFK